jgi:hypothetical protein
MIDFRLAPAALAALLLATPLAAQETGSIAVQPIPPIAAPLPVTATAPPVQMVYVYPTSPSTFVPMAGLPSFLFMPGAPLPEIGTYVVHAVPVPAVASMPIVVAAGDIDCDQLPGPVQVLPPDRFDLDKDGDGIGCEPEDR